MNDIRAGDVVVCINDEPCRCGCNEPVSVRRGTLYRVIHVCWDDQQVIVTLAGVNHKTQCHPEGEGICIDRFRKIDPADEGFTEIIRACRPIKQPA